MPKNALCEFSATLYRLSVQKSNCGPNLIIYHQSLPPPHRPLEAAIGDFEVEAFPLYSLAVPNWGVSSDLGKDEVGCSLMRTSGRAKESFVCGDDCTL